MEGSTKKKAQPHHPHHMVPKHESGYTDEAAVEAHDLIDKAEEDAHVSAHARHPRQLIGGQDYLDTDEGPAA